VGEQPPDKRSRSRDGSSRFALNDEASSELLVGALSDVGTGATLISAEGSRRLTDAVSLGIDARWFVVDDDSDPLYFFRRESHVQLYAQFFWI